jgi:hypothetical protein
MTDKAAPASETPEKRLDNLFALAFDANHPAMLDYADLKFRLRAAEQKMELMRISAEHLEREYVAATKLAVEAEQRAERTRREALAGVSDLPGLIDALSHQKQCDRDGVECQVSRQAVDEALSVLRALAQKEAKRG